MTTRILVIGGDAAGMSAASKARRVDSTTDVVVLERGSVASFAACGIPYYVGGVIPEADDLVARRPEAFARAGIDLRVGIEAVAIDPDARTVAARDATGEARFEYDELVVATGATALRPPIDGLDGAGVFTVRHLDDGVALRAFVDERAVRAATIVGGGYIGLEFAETLRGRGIDVTVVDIAEQVMPGLDSDLADLVSDELDAHGVRVRTGTTVSRIVRDGDGEVVGVEADGERWDADLVVVGGGARPASDLAEAAGIPLDAFGAIVTDERMATPVAGVWAAGDVTGVTQRVTGARAYVPLGPAANKQGRVAGENAAGGDATFPGVVGTSVVKVFDVAVARTGLSEADCEAQGLACASATIESRDRAGYYPGAQQLTVRLVGERGTGRVLGGQLVGGGAAKRVDVVATAVTAGLRAHEVAELDLAYAPPYSPVWDPVLIAAGELDKALGGSRPVHARAAGG